MKDILTQLKEKIKEEEKKTKDKLNLILLNKIAKETKELKEKEKEIKKIKEKIIVIKEHKNAMGDFEEKTILYIHVDEESIKGVFLVKQEKNEMNMDTMYTFKGNRRKGIGMELAEVAYEHRETAKAYAYPITAGSKKIMQNLGLYEMDDKEDNVWVNKEEEKERL